jgi:hypothetical protein
MTDPAPLLSATEAWSALEGSSIRRRWGRLVVHDEPGGRGNGSLWTLVHVLAAANDLAAVGRDPGLGRLLGLLSRYRADRGYLPTPGAHLRYVDDNAWLGLLCMRIAARTGNASHRRRAQRIASFLLRASHPDGGIRWREGHPSRNVCSTAPTAELVLALGTSKDDVAFASEAAAWLDGTLRRDDGLLADRIEDGEVEPTVWSYNQGAAIGLYRMLAERTDDDRHRQRARELAEASLEIFAGSRAWTEPPPFLAVWFRELLALPEAADRARSVLATHLDRLVDEGREPRTGFFTAGGVGSYDGLATIDQAAIVQLFALAGGAPPAPAG